MVFTGRIPLRPLRRQIGLGARGHVQGQQLQPPRKMSQQISGQGLFLAHDSVYAQQQVLRGFAQFSCQLGDLAGVHGCPFSASGGGIRSPAYTVARASGA